MQGQTGAKELHTQAILLHCFMLLDSHHCLCIPQIKHGAWNERCQKIFNNGQLVVTKEGERKGKRD